MGGAWETIETDPKKIQKFELKDKDFKENR